MSLEVKENKDSTTNRSILEPDMTLSSGRLNKLKKVSARSFQPSISQFMNLRWILDRESQ